ncbi:hypothetical protein TSMG0065 [Halocynthia phage JM-2012]|uniref:hypothetical protein n=1 Tax=Halocynthia phage JM-2012 TaxID=1173297 RepID=UPI00025C6915|nr:hypothetical protein TSMG0065 [Halocynthia phage JM-2012]AFI55348.1 hypothetical protein TSMG0065 [Halocynthia phage JM-2012]
MGFNSKNKQHRSLDVTCAFNVLPLIDHLTGQWVVGEDEENILVGGFVHHTGIIAPANAGKSALGLHMFCAVGNRYQNTTGHIYETEGTMPAGRVTEASARLHDGEPFDIKQMVHDEEPRFSMIDGTSLKLDAWADTMAEERDVRNKQRGVKKHEVTLPFKLNEVRGNKVVKPMIVFIDSATEAEATSVTKLQEEGTDATKGQTSFMRDGWVKTKVYGRSMVSMATQGDIFVISTGSIDSFVDMGGMPGKAPEKTMGHMAGSKRMKGLGTSYKKLTSNIWQFGQPKPLFKGTASKDKLPMFPLNKDDEYLDNKDLEFVSIQNLRGKAGGSGAVFELVRSQRDGILPGVTEFLFLKTWGKVHKEYGYHSPAQYQFALDLLPEVTFRNTTLRETINNNPLFRRALELTFGMKMEFIAKQSVECTKYRCTPKELYDDIKSMGFDWNILLNTRGFWQFKEEEDPSLPYLSILDLLKMRVGEYTPKWYSKG